MGLTTTIGYYQPAGDTYQPAGTYPAGNYGYTPSRSTNLREDLEIGEEEIGEFVKALKSNMLPLLVEEFKKVELPKVDESVEAGKLGTICASYCLSFLLSSLPFLLTSFFLFWRSSFWIRWDKDSEG